MLDTFKTSDEIVERILVFQVELEAKKLLSVCQRCFWSPQVLNEQFAYWKQGFHVIGNLTSVVDLNLFLTTCCYKRRDLFL